ncbi:hypothetical protein BASA60_007943 [Batrachochytrium salamandrivorans]|nr:hypothetical protein BASA60_007943 [Batrachochytrium salamandrivorans]
MIPPAKNPASLLSSIQSSKHSSIAFRDSLALLQAAFTNLYELLYMPPSLVDTFSLIPRDAGVAFLMVVLAVSSIFNVVSIIAPAMTPASFLSSIHFPTHSVNLVRNASALLQVASTNLVTS